MTTSGLRAVRFVVLLASLSSSAAAQLIPIKTVPIAQGDQFQIFPSNNLGMGGVGIALADSLQDPFVNPATGARVRAGRFFSAPTVYSISRNTGGGRSLPFATLARRGAWYGGLAVALQQVEPSRAPENTIITPLPGFDVRDAAGQAIPEPDDRAHTNRYLFAMAGKELPGSGLSVGVSALWSGLHALDGLDLLYADSRRVEEAGHTLDLRLGLLKEWAGGRSVEAVLLHNRFVAAHDVIYVDQVWDPGLQRFNQIVRTEHNDDRTTTWGMHLEYQMPLGSTGWHVGGIATANRLSHPKTPDYATPFVSRVPLEPGRTSAYNLGLGLSKVQGPATFAIEGVLEPIRSYTWDDAQVPTFTASGGTIPVGGKTLENRFTFANTLFRMGASRDVELNGPGKAAGFQVGLSVRSIKYRLNQTDNVELVQRRLETGWVEWSPTWGLSLRFPELEIRYRGRVTHGASRAFAPPFFPPGVVLERVSIIAPPIGPLNLMDVNTTTHQISISLPLR
jgi:hypothetical protein